jgi:hypothetical protein
MTRGDPLPMWIANGTDATSGSRLLTVPISVSDQTDAAEQAWPFGHAYDVLGLLRADVPISTALNNTARFPYLEPFGAVLPRNRGAGGENDGKPHEIIDGGYFENERLETALELGEWLTREGPKLLKTKAVEPIIVQATASGSAPDPSAAIVRCTDPGLGPHQPASTGELQIFAPLIGLYSVRGGHSAAALRHARDTYCKSPDGKPAHAFSTSIWGARRAAMCRSTGCCPGRWPRRCGRRWTMAATRPSLIGWTRHSTPWPLPRCAGSATNRRPRSKGDRSRGLVTAGCRGPGA